MILINSMIPHPVTLQWRHNERDDVWNHHFLNCLLNRLFRCKSDNNKTHVSLDFVRGIHHWPVVSPHKGPVLWKVFHVLGWGWDWGLGRGVPQYNSLVLPQPIISKILKRNGHPWEAITYIWRSDISNNDFPMSQSEFWLVLFPGSLLTIYVLNFSEGA